MKFDYFPIIFLFLSPFFEKSLAATDENFSSSPQQKVLSSVEQLETEKNGENSLTFSQNPDFTETKSENPSVTIEENEDFEIDNENLTAEATTTTTMEPNDSTTSKNSGIPRPPSFTAWSFFLGLIVAALIISLAYFLFKFLFQLRSSNNISYASYQ